MKDYVMRVFYRVQDRFPWAGVAGMIAGMLLACLAVFVFGKATTPEILIKQQIHDAVNLPSSIPPGVTIPASLPPGYDRVPVTGLSTRPPLPHHP